MDACLFVCLIGRQLSFRRFAGSQVHIRFASKQREYEVHDHDCDWSHNAHVYVHVHLGSTQARRSHCPAPRLSPYTMVGVTRSVPDASSPSPKPAGCARATSGLSARPCLPASSPGEASARSCILHPASSCLREHSVDSCSPSLPVPCSFVSFHLSHLCTPSASTLCSLAVRCLLPSADTLRPDVYPAFRYAPATAYTRTYMRRRVSTVHRPRNSKHRGGRKTCGFEAASGRTGGCRCSPAHIRHHVSGLSQTLGMYTAQGQGRVRVRVRVRARDRAGERPVGSTYSGTYSGRRDGETERHESPVTGRARTRVRVRMRPVRVRVQEY